jgi:pimeloyl-ACP methyl ester carboxylesterase
VLVTNAADGASLCYEVAGAGPVLLLVHGITDCHHSWDPLIGPLAEDYKVVAVDLRGHGTSERRPPYDAATMAADLRAVAIAVGAVDPLVVGHSLGGAVVSLYAAAGQVRGVVNVDQQLEFSAFKDALTAIEPMLRGDEATFRSVMEAIVDSNLGPLPDDERKRVLAQSVPEQEVVLGVWDVVLTSTGDELGGLAETLRSITVPYLALHGDEPGEPYRAWLRSAIPSSTIEVWPDHGHFPHLVDPERFVERLHDFEHRL